MPNFATDVTLVAVDTRHPLLAARALARSQQRTGAARAILFSDTAIEGDFAWVRIDRLRSIRDYSLFVLRALNRHIETEFALVLQWDGFVTDAGCWTDAFFACDYIGARWPHIRGPHTVGNGGFSLRSKKLLDLTARHPSWRDRFESEDVVIGIRRRRWLEDRHGIRFASPDLADRFSREYADVPGPTFGFHGPSNLWKYVPSAEYVEIAETLGSDFCRGWVPALALVHYFRAGDTDSAVRIARMVARYVPPPVFRKSIRRQCATDAESETVLAGVGCR